MKIRRFLLVMFFIFAVFGGYQTPQAFLLPNDVDMTNIETFLNSVYFGPATYIEITPLDFNFTGSWLYTAIATEAGNKNIAEDPNAMSIRYSPSNYSNWGSWSLVDFNSGNIYITDKKDGPTDYPVNPLTVSDSAFFRLFQLTADSKPLTYLDDDPIFTAGTYILAWNDNLSSQNNDADYDDLVLAMKSVPEPTSMFLFGTGLLGIGGYFRIRSKK
jgi:hypothetical protein